MSAVLPWTVLPSAGLPAVNLPSADLPAVDLPSVHLPSLPADRFLDRELSWLDFNARVLALAEDPATPLLERVKFLAIFASNLDAFYMVRVARLHRQWRAGLPMGNGNRPPRARLDLISGKVADLVTRHTDCLTEEVLPALAAQGVHLPRWAELDPTEHDRLRAYFQEEILPVLTPLVVDPAAPFPYVFNRSLHLAVVLADPTVAVGPGTGGSSPADGPERLAWVRVPQNVPRFVRVERDAPGSWFLPVEELVAAQLGQLFPGRRVVGCHPFRVTRTAEVEVAEERDGDLLQVLERRLARRRFGPLVRLEVAVPFPDRVLKLLSRLLAVDLRDVSRVPGRLDLSALWQLYEEVDRPDLKERPFVPATHPRLATEVERPGDAERLAAEVEGPGDVFAALRNGDILVHHPYHSFATSVQRFVTEAAADPDVLAIKLTLYRTSGDSPIVAALVAAAAAGRQVVVLVEVRARFDEVANIGWARMLDRAGCQVVYGLAGLKTHAKVALVVRREGDGIRRYCHVGTGNYHPRTARLYEDLGLLTADPEVGADVSDLFDVLTGCRRQVDYRRLLVAPHGLRRGLVERIDREIVYHRSGRPGLIQIKVNSLVDEEIVEALYRASQAGVRVDLVVRGMCTLRPGIPGLSENIRVRSIVGRFLEHSRIFRFGSGSGNGSGSGSGNSSGSGPGSGSGGSGEAEFWFGSADLMHRNLHRRVEALVRVTDPVARAELDHLLTAAMSPQVAAFELAADGSWHRHTGTPDGRSVHLHELLLRRAVTTRNRRSAEMEHHGYPASATDIP
ncbi:polyphosphate kinase [Micromonospora polyrhachis]|uniref:Polyphosphate kinase n=1 Tax=Micromonospora polyrhachis TaxID=1282883 RepID=A0A7W7SPY4_9ACTN|nr:RNA degradosome polyphosphate kinase [Micromonospora polyrhachis]MBB4957570.1 polyphosphate kinase [Micromonospora polyrhachis]